jgi:hypothetical protein
LPKADRTLFLNGGYVLNRLGILHQAQRPLFTISQLHDSTFFSIWLTLVIPESERISSAEKAALLKSAFSRVQISRDEILASKFEIHLVADKEDGTLDNRALADPRNGWMGWQERELLGFQDFKHWDYFQLRLEIEYYDESSGETSDWSEPEFYLETHQSFVARGPDISAEGYLQALAANSRELMFPEESADYG